MKTFNKILIANRGEIAVRVIKAAKSLNIKTVAIYSDVEEDALHRRLADESSLIGSYELHDSYLNIDKIIKVAQQFGCDAIHPGYGFLSENPLFVKACEDNQLTFIGPTAEVMQLMGNKIQARRTAQEAGIPVTTGLTGTPAEILSKSAELPYPVLVKAAAGGGGKGIRIVNAAEDLSEALESTSREAKAYFADGSVYVEQYLANPRHIEIQVLGDHHGNYIHLFERECSIQRRYQKVIEEAPSPTISSEKRLQMCSDALALAKKISYTNAGTLEFLVDENMNHYFLEMNTRIQVEHPVTEKTTGIDLVQQQLMIAAGNAMQLKQDEIVQKGHAIECRVYAEDPANDFSPSPGLLCFYESPSKELADIHSGIEEAVRIESFFDPMISKVVVYGNTREEAISKGVSALQQYGILGIKTNIPFLLSLLSNNDFITNNVSTTFCDEQLNTLNEDAQQRKDNISENIPAIAYLSHHLIRESKESNIWDEIGYWRSYMNVPMLINDKEISVQITNLNGSSGTFQIGNNTYDARIIDGHHQFLAININDYLYQLYIADDHYGMGWMSINGSVYNVKRNDLLISEDFFSGSSTTASNANHVVSPLPGKVTKVNFNVGDQVKKGDVLLIIEAMKMENNIVAPRDAIIDKVNVKENEMVDGQAQLIIFESESKD